MRRRGIYTHLEGNDVYMREEHCLHGSGPAEEGTKQESCMNDELATVQQENFMKIQS